MQSYLKLYAAPRKKLQVLPEAFFFVVASFILKAMAEKVHAVGVIFENEHKQILVLGRHLGSLEGATWGLVGGKVEPGETKETAAIRETQEEVGHTIDPSQLTFVKTYHWDREDLDILFEVFRLQVVSEAVTLEIDENESTEHMWVDPRELYGRTDLMIGLYPILRDVYQTAPS